MRRGPRVIRDDRDMITVKGLNYATFNSIITAAILHCHEELRRNNISEETRRYNKERLKLCQALCPPPVWVNPYRQFPISMLKPHQVASRRGEVKMERSARRNLERAMKELFK